MTFKPKERDMPEGHEAPVVRDFVDAVAKCTNGWLMLICASVPEEFTTATPARVLEEALESGRVDEAIKVQDRAYGWGNYTTHDTGEPTYREGSFVPDAYSLDMTPLSAEELQVFLVRMCSVRGVHAANPPHHHDPVHLAAELAYTLFGVAVGHTASVDGPTWTHWRVQPTFLRSGDGDVESEGGLNYFEDGSSNLALFSVRGSRFVLFLLNPYPVLPGGEWV